MDSGEVVGPKLQLPQIYKLLTSGTDDTVLVPQIISDQNAQRNAGEKVLLGIRTLQTRGKAGVAALRTLTQEEGIAGVGAKLLLQNPKAISQSLEKVLNIRRWGTLVSTRHGSDDEYVHSIYDHAIARGYTKMSLTDFAGVRAHETSAPLSHHFRSDFGTPLYLHVSGDTFGALEPTYLELLGPEEILRLRALTTGNMLLLGSMGQHSAAHFANYNRKINPHLKSHVIDIDPHSVQLMREDHLSVPREIVQGDARDLQYPDGFAEHIYTNGLFPFLRQEGDPHAAYVGDIQKVMKSAHRALVPGGSLVIAEGPFGAHKARHKFNPANMEIKSLALAAGFRLATQLSPDAYTYYFNAEVGASTINENGFPHYENTLIEVVRNTLASMRFVKP